MRYFLLISYALFLCFFFDARTSCKADDSPGFFLKITKNVPRLGRRSDKEFENGFLKGYKSVPRIGRSVGNNQDLSLLTNWLNEPFYMRNINKRVMNPMQRLTIESELSVVQPVNSNTLMELLNKDAIPSDNVKFVHWKDFDRALQRDAQLYSKVISLGRKPDQSLKQDIAVGGYIPLMSNSMDDDGNDFLLYNSGGQYDGPYSSDFVHYNRI